MHLHIIYYFTTGRHARLEVVRHKQQVRCMLTDLGSPAGTWHNCTRLRPFEDVRLSVGDVIELGGAPDSKTEVKTAVCCPRS